MKVTLWQQLSVAQIYSSDAYGSIIAKHGFQQSMSRKGHCWDNAPMESLFKTMKAELLYPRQQNVRIHLDVFEHTEHASHKSTDTSSDWASEDTHGFF